MAVRPPGGGLKARRCREVDGATRPAGELEGVRVGLVGVFVRVVQVDDARREAEIAGGIEAQR